MERIRWAGISWGSGSAALNLGVGVSFVLLGLPGTLFALSADSVVQGLFIALFAVVMLVCAPVLFINAHFCRELERRRLHHHSPGRPATERPHLANGRVVDTGRTAGGAAGCRYAPGMTEPSRPQSPPPGQSPTLSPPAGWYVDGPGSERWWDGVRWTEHVRAAAGSAPGPATATAATQGGQRPTEVLRLERIRWAGIAWGGYGGETASIAVGVLFVLLGLPGVLFALVARDWVQGLPMALFVLLFFTGAAVFFINAHFCRELSRRPHHPGR